MALHQHLYQKLQPRQLDDTGTAAIKFAESKQLWQLQQLWHDKKLQHLQLQNQKIANPSQSKTKALIETKRSRQLRKINIE
jgi:hypothetical protein